jgi:heavy metal efflux system protein
VIKEVSYKIDNQVMLPTGYYVSYGGQFQNLEAAKARLYIAVPVALLLIFVLLYFSFHSVKQSLLIFTAVPMSAIGGIFALWMRGMNFSISAGVGFIALFGVAVLNGIVLISQFNRLEKEGFIDITQRVLKGLHTRLRPVIMTAAVASLGFLPMALSTSAGAEVQKPLATVVIGGLISATFLTLVILPVFYIIFSSRKFIFSFKTKSLKTLSLIAFLIMGSSILNTSKAQQIKTIGLHDAIQMALDSNLSVRSTAYSVDFQKALKGASWDIPKTAIDGQYGQFNSYTKDNSFTVSQSFAFPTVYINQNKLANANVESSKLQLKASQLDIATQIKLVWWQMVYLHSKQKLFEWQDSLYSGFFSAAELRAKSGETNQLEMITARSQSLEMKNQLHQVIADLDIYRLKMKLLMNVESVFYPADTLLHRIQFKPYSDSSSISNNPSVGYAKQQVEISRVEKNLESSRMLPDFNIGYFSQTMQGIQDVNGLPRTFSTGDRFTGIQAGIEIPLWFVPYTSKTKAAKLNEQIARINAESFSKSLLGSYRSLMVEYSKYSNSVDYYEKQALPEADIIIEQATRSYKAGAMDYLDYVQNLSRALDIKKNYLDALHSYNQTIINIEFITGKVF